MAVVASGVLTNMCQPVSGRGTGNKKGIQQNAFLTLVNGEPMD